MALHTLHQTHVEGLKSLSIGEKVTDKNITVTRAIGMGELTLVPMGSVSATRTAIKKSSECAGSRRHSHFLTLRSQSLRFAEVRAGSQGSGVGALLVFRRPRNLMYKFHSPWKFISCDEDDFWKGSVLSCAEPHPEPRTPKPTPNLVEDVFGWVGWRPRFC